SGGNLVGAGPGKTVIVGAHAKTAIINFGIDLNIDAWTTHNISGGASQGSTNVTLDSSRSLRRGELMLLDELNDTNLVVISGSSALFGRGHGARAIGHLARIEAISGNRITFWPPLHWTYTNSYSPQLAQ